MTRKDRIGVLVLSFLVILSFYLPSLIHRALEGPRVLEDSSWIAALRELENTPPAEKYAEKQNQGPAYPRYSAGKTQLKPFFFDPNILDREGWRELGLPERTVSTILRYREKGGRFRSPADLKKIYGIRPEQYDILEKYISILPAPTRYPEPGIHSPEKTFRKYSEVDINLADSNAFIALPGIGSKLARRIISFRDKLGGFYSIEQLREVYGLADSVFQKIKGYLKLQDSHLKKINLNLASELELGNHPYIRFALAKTIVAYRKEHGPFKSTGDLKNILSIPVKDLERMTPYLSVD